MRISRTATYAISALAAAALLAACSSGGSQSSFAPSSGVSAPAGHHVGLPDKMHAYVTVKMPKVHTDHSKSWVSPDVKKAPRLMFVSDAGTNDVYIFTMPDVVLKGTLTGFSQPQGMCDDASGNVWVANTNTSQVMQFSRTGSLLNTLSDPGEYPVGCAVNKANGDLYVSNIINTSGGPGNIMVYTGGTGSGSPISNPNQYEYYFGAFDSAGNYYVSGWSNSFFYLLSECPAGSSSCKSLSISGGSITFPGTVNWDRVNGNLLVGDQECGGALASCVHQATVSGSTVTFTGQTTLSNFDGTACDVPQGSIAPFSKYYAGPCITFGTSVSSASRWAYPAGGTPNWYSTSVSFPIGSAISNK